MPETDKALGCLLWVFVVAALYVALNYMDAIMARLLGS